MPPKNQELRKNQSKERTPEEQLEQDRQLIWYWLADGNMRQLRGVLLDQDEKTLRTWVGMCKDLLRELQKAQAWHRSGALEGGSPASDQAGPAKGDQGS